MPFKREKPAIPSEILDISIALFDPDPTRVDDKGDPEPRSIKVRSQVKRNGDIIERTDDLMVNITNEDKEWLLDFMDRLRPRLVREMLPEET